jgi:hypothetical protein
VIAATTTTVKASGDGRRPITDFGKDRISTPVPAALAGACQCAANPTIQKRASEPM